MKGLMKVLPYLYILVLLLSGAVGCNNIFSFATDKEKTPVAKAEEDIRNGDYSMAKGELENYIQNGTDDSMILYTYAKATLLDAGVDLGEIVELVQGETTVQKGLNNPILQKIDSFSPEKQNAWYQSNTEVATLLKKIYKDETTGIFTKEDIALDYTISNVISTVLGLRDTNQDGAIDYSVDFQLDLISLGGAGELQGFILGNIKTDELGNPVLNEENLPINEGLKVFLGGWDGKTLKINQINEEKLTPDDINNLVAFILTKLDEGEESIMFLITLYTDQTDEASSIDYEEVKNYIFDIGKYVNYYWYDDGIDNDGDGRIDEETINGVDDDGDGLIDEDTDRHPSDTTREENKQNLGLFNIWKNR